MAEHEFHVHGAHDHEVEHEAHHGPGLAQQIAIFTAILSTLGAVISYQGGDTENRAMLYKNEAVLQKSLASDQWNYFQAKSTKGHLMEMAANLAPPDKQEYYKKQAEKYNQEKKEIMAKAEEYDKKSEEANHESEHHMHPHHKLAQSMTFIQIAISLASITVLTRKRWLFIAAGIAAAIGSSLWALAWFS
ncbi:Membrane protein [Gammaproteobacteria bacterium]